MRGIASALLLAFVAGLPFVAVPADAIHSGEIVCPYSDQLAVVDGTITLGEYADSYTDPGTSMTVYLQYSGDTMAIGLWSPGQGWLAIAFGSVAAGTEYMNFLAAYVDAGTGVVAAVDGVDHGWELHWDTGIGGTDDILRVAGAKDAAGTTVEFHFPLNSTDPNDHHFEPGGTYGFALAYSAASSDFNATDSSHSPQLFLQIGEQPSFLPLEGTAIAVSETTRLVADETGTVSAVLRNASGIGLSGQALTFSMETAFGTLLLGEAMTNAAGKATIAYTPRAAGTWTILVSFAGQGRFLPTIARITVIVEEAPAILAFLRTDTAIALVIVVVVGSIWLTYLFVAYQLSAIRDEGLGRPPFLAGLPRLRLHKRKGGENHG